jgi:hypothetical protein
MERMDETLWWLARIGVDVVMFAVFYWLGHKAGSDAGNRNAAKELASIWNKCIPDLVAKQRELQEGVDKRLDEIMAAVESRGVRV